MRCVTFSFSTVTSLFDRFQTISFSSSFAFSVAYSHPSATKTYFMSDHECIFSQMKQTYFSFFVVNEIKSHRFEWFLAEQKQKQQNRLKMSRCLDNWTNSIELSNRRQYDTDFCRSIHVIPVNCSQNYRHKSDDENTKRKQFKFMSASGFNICFV